MSRTKHHISRGRLTEGDPLWKKWWKKEPKWWRKMMKHRKRRAELREALQKDPEDTAYPLDKKPWIWYW